MSAFMERLEACLFRGLNDRDYGIDRDAIRAIDIVDLVASYRSVLPRPIKDARTTSAKGMPVRILAFVPPYGWSMAHFENGKWQCHSVLNNLAQPTHFIPMDNIPTPPTTGEGK